ncbi:site-specific DNA-methyltransferase [Rhizobium ruizarguesonis]
MDKLKMHTPDLTRENIVKIGDLFPGCITEASDENGQVRLVIDFDQLRQELGDDIVESSQERYRLDWPGKNEALALSNSPIAKMLRPQRSESLDFDKTRNIFIEGDNLDAMKIIQNSYLGSVKLIYVDPPYNTGNDFIYDDDFTESRSTYLERSNQTAHSGDRLVANTEANGRFHSDWLSMMYPRLRLARNLLKDDGAIFISIDDEEVHNLRKLCDEIFGAENFIAQFIWKARQFTDTRAKTNVSTDHEYVVAYAKNLGFSLKGVGRDESKFSNPDNDPRGDWMSRSILGLATRDLRPNLHYDITEPGTGRSFPPNPSTGWRYSMERMRELTSEGRILFPKNDDGRPREKKFRSEMKSDFIAFRSIIDDVHTADGTQEIRSLFGADLFPFPKPVDLLASIVEQVTSDDDIVMDLFVGSGTTAQAVMQVNSSDGGQRRYIMVQLAEPCGEKSEAYKAGYRTIAELSRERIRRAASKISKNSVMPNKVDVGFRAMRVDTSCMVDVFYRPDTLTQSGLFDAVDQVKPDRVGEDLLFQVLTDWGVAAGPMLPITVENLGGLTLYLVNRSEFSGPDLIACFEPNISEEVMRDIARYQPLRVVFRDSSFVSDAAKINVEQIFRQLSPGTEVKTI